jgi:hypothetical protein
MRRIVNQKGDTNDKFQRDAIALTGMDIPIHP